MGRIDRSRARVVPPSDCHASSRLAVELSWPAQGHPASVVKRYMLARALCWSSRLVLASTGFTCF
eukprot:scaffold11206_cov117-Isochrysis_galbana.AAC.1